MLTAGLLIVDSNLSEQNQEHCWDNNLRFPAWNSLQKWLRALSEQAGSEGLAYLESFPKNHERDNVRLHPKTHVDTKKQRKFVDRQIR